MMRRGVLLLLLVALAALAAVGIAESVEVQEEVAVDVDSELLVEEETVEAEAEAEAEPQQQMDPRLTEEAFAKIFSKLTAKCLQQVQANPTDPSQVSDRCRAEVGRRIQRYLERLDSEEKNGKDSDHEKAGKKKRKSKKSKKQTRAERAAAEALKKEEDYQQTLQVVIGFVATIVAVVVGATCFINRKLKAAGMYFPDPDAKANCCG
ncbi:hypothetical protein BBJ28_00009949 [Nothophytophthora sp. Chile5]|nr:hypothetical protein BBJ28_00009949 [Nothophytophthora sp. Chile5]